MGPWPVDGSVLSASTDITASPSLWRTRLNICGGLVAYCDVMAKRTKTDLGGRVHVAVLLPCRAIHPWLCLAPR